MVSGFLYINSSSSKCPTSGGRSPPPCRRACPACRPSEGRLPRGLPCQPEATGLATKRLQIPPAMSLSTVRPGVQFRMKYCCCFGARGDHGGGCAVAVLPYLNCARIRGVMSVHGGSSCCCYSGGGQLSTPNFAG